MAEAKDERISESTVTTTNANRCSHCGKEKTESELHDRLVRDGISTDYLALPFLYKRKQFCDACFTWHGRKDRIERVLAIIGLIIVISLIFSMLIPAFFR